MITRQMATLKIAVALGLFGATTASMAAKPPAVVNYQGILRDTLGVPQFGSFDMVFRFFDASAGGNEILVDSHMALGSGAVTVTNGLFNVGLGSGIVTDGSATLPNDPYGSLTELFRDYQDVWMEISIDGEVLSPRVKILSAAYALNADRVDGKDGAELLDTSFFHQIKSGPLTVQNLTVQGGNVFGIGNLQVGAIDTGVGLTEVYAMNQPVRTTDAVVFSTVNTGPGVTEVHLMNQNVRTSDFVSFLGVNTGQGYNSLYGMNQGVRTTDAVTFSSVNTGALTASTVNTGPGVTEVQLMDQNIRTTDSVRFNAVGIGTAPTAVPLTFPLALGDKISLWGDYGLGIQPNLLQIKTDIFSTDIAFGYGPSASFVENLRIDQGGFNNVILNTLNPRMVFCSSCDGNPATDGWFEWREDGTDLMMYLQSPGALFLDGGLFPNDFDLAESFWAGRPIAPGTVVRIDAARPDAVVPTGAEYDTAMLGVVSTTPSIIMGGHAFSVETLRNKWGDAIAGQFESQRAKYRDQVLGVDKGLQERDRQVKSVAAFESVSPGLAPADAAPEYQKAKVEHEAEVERQSLALFFEENFAAVALSGRVPVLVDASFGAVAPGDYLTASPIPGVAMKATRSGPVLGTALESLPSGRASILAFVHRGDHVEPDGIALIQQTQSTLATALSERTPDPRTGVQTVAGNLQLVLDRNADNEARFSVFRDGRQELDGELMRLDEDGNLLLKGALRPDAMDIAEYFPVSEPVTLGDVLTVDGDNPGRYRLAATVADRAVVGIVSSRPGVVLGSGIERVAGIDPDLARQIDDARHFGDAAAESRIWAQLERRFRETHAAVALTGTTLIKVDAGYGEIRPGDLLVSSPTRGHAMRSDEPEVGTVIGKALEPLAHGTGIIRALVMMR